MLPLQRPELFNRGQLMKVGILHISKFQLHYYFRDIIFYNYFEKLLWISYTYTFASCWIELDFPILAK